MKKEKLIKFINILKDRNIVDNVSVNNLDIINYLVSNNLINFKNFNKVVTSSKNIINRMFTSFIGYKKENLQFLGKSDTNYQKIRKELYNYPSYNENEAEEIKDKINEINFRFNYLLEIEDIKVNIYYYSSKDDYKLFQRLANIIYLFIHTFSANIKDYDDYNIRFLLIDFPRKLDSNNNFYLLGQKGYYNNSSGINMFTKKELVVSRKSGINGLLIHELIHMVGLDFYRNPNDKNITNIDDWEKKWIKENNILLKKNGISSFAEGICNSNSSYFLAIYNAIELSAILDINKVQKYFKYFLYIEFIYSYLNAIKLFSYFNRKSYDSIFNSSNDRFYYQNAYVFEYVVLRMFILSNYFNNLFQYMIKFNFNKKNNSKDDNALQLKLNKKLLEINRNKLIKDDYDNLADLLDNFENSIYIEYFGVNINY